MYEHALVRSVKLLDPLRKSLTDSILRQDPVTHLSGLLNGQQVRSAVLRGTGGRWICWPGLVIYEAPVVKEGPHPVTHVRTCAPVVGMSALIYWCNHRNYYSRLDN